MGLTGSGRGVTRESPARRVGMLAMPGMADRISGVTRLAQPIIHCGMCGQCANVVFIVIFIVVVLSVATCERQAYGSSAGVYSRRVYGF